MRAKQESRELYSSIRPFRAQLWAFLQLLSGVDVTARNRAGWTSLHIAAYRGHYHVARALLKRGADPDAADEDGTRPLHLAGEGIGARSTRVLRLLLESGADPNVRTREGETPLHRAVRRKTEDVRLLLDAGADVTARGHLAEMPLHSAAREDEPARVQLLLDAGAPVDPRGDHGVTPLLLGAYMAAAKSVRVLLEAGADVAAATERGETAIDAARGDVHPGKWNEYGHSGWGEEKDRAWIERMLLECGARPGVGFSYDDEDYERDEDWDDDELDLEQDEAA